PAIARWWSISSRKRSGVVRRWWRSCTMTTSAARSAIPSSTSPVSPQWPEGIMTGSDLVLSNARIVLAARVIQPGPVAVGNGLIVEIGEGTPPGHGADVGGDLLLPGLGELPTDHIEAHYVPRPKVVWDPVAAVVSYDGQLASCGITTVLDSLRVWREE